jgi:hypothetical protein
MARDAAGEAKKRAEGSGVVAKDAGKMGDGNEEQMDQELRDPNDEYGLINQTLQARHDIWIQTLKNHPVRIEGGVYLSTFQKGRGQHFTALDTRQARMLAERLITLADEIELEVEVNRRAIDR